MILHLLRLRILMSLLSLPTEILFHHLVLSEMLKSCVVRSNTLLIFLFLVLHKIAFVQSYLVPFLNTVNAQIDCAKEIVSVNFGGVSHEFNFSKFRRQPHDIELPSKNEIVGLASIDVPPTDPLEQYLVDHENDLHMNERNVIDEVFFS